MIREICSQDGIERSSELYPMSDTPKNTVNDMFLFSLLSARSGLLT